MKEGGKIIAIEGIDGAGKTTHASNLSAELMYRNAHFNVMRGLSFFEYEAESHFHRTYRTVRRNIPLGKNSLSLWFAADLSVRWEHFGQPTYDSGGIVIADRYYFSSFVRDGIRGIDIRKLRVLYDFLPIPSLLVYMKISPQIAYNRIVERAGEPGYYESGRDFRPAADPRTGFISYQTQCQKEYEKLIAQSPCPVLILEDDLKPNEAAHQVLTNLFAD